MTKYDIGYSESSEKVYLGKSKEVNGHSEWVGEKKDITSRFIQIMEQKFPLNTSQNISINGENKYRVIIVDMEKEVIVNGRTI